MHYDDEGEDKKDFFTELKESVDKQVWFFIFC